MTRSGPGLERPVRVLLAKPGLDGHDRGIKVVARALRDAGMEIVYLGLRRSPEQILRAAQVEDPDVIALSILSGAHLGLTRKLLASAPDFGVEGIPVVIGGTIPRGDAERLREMGVAEVFGVGTGLDALVDGVRRVAGRGRASRGEVARA
jgi:methylmalonyl-CoA mutase C-terminal domain/subunit